MNKPWLKHWRPTPLVWVGALVHVLAPLPVLFDIALWPWSVGAVVLVHLAWMAQGLWPRSTGLGPNLVRLPDDAAARGEIAITIDDGPDPDVTPQMLTLLAQHGAKATFFCIATQAEAHPALLRAIVHGGHEIGNHGHRHPLGASLMGPGGWFRELSLGQATLQRLSGTSPNFYRAVAGLRNPFLDPVLHSLNLRLASWTRRGYDTQSGDADRVFQRLTRGLKAGDILLLHDGHAARTPDGRPVGCVVLERLLPLMASRGLRAVKLSDACKLTNENT